MTRKISNYFTVGHKYKGELKRQIRSLIIITLGFTIAFSWRQTTFDLSTSFVQFITNVQSSAAASVLASIFITMLSLIFILATSRFLRIEEHY